MVRSDRAAREIVLAPIDELRAATALLTRIPVGAAPSGRRTFERTGAAAFGLVGGSVGVAGAVPLVLLGDLIALPAAILAVATIALLTGALHLDGVADSADALLAMGAGAAERARKDPASGPGGVVAVVTVIGLEVACLDAILTGGGAPLAAGALVIGCSVSRTIAVILARSHHTAAMSLGSAARFSHGTTTLAAAVTVVSSACVVGAVAVVAGAPSLAGAGAAGALIGLGLSVGLVRVRRQVDGDALGAAVELTVVAVLLTAAIVPALVVVP